VPPGGSSWSVLTTDLAITDIYPNTQPTGSLFARITNRGSESVPGVEVTLACSGLATSTVTPGVVVPFSETKKINLTIDPGQTQAFNSGVSINTDQFEYNATCVLTVPVKDTDTSNNQYTEAVPGPWTANTFPIPPVSTPNKTDLGVTDVYPDVLPQGTVWVRIMNFGPESLQNTTIKVTCKSEIHAWATGNVVGNDSKTFDMTFINTNPGQQNTFITGLQLDTSQYWYNITCSISPSFDSNSSNNSYSEPIPMP
jgi:hypothetical protein